MSIALPIAEPIEFVKESVTKTGRGFDCFDGYTSGFLHGISLQKCHGDVPRLRNDAMTKCHSSQGEIYV